LTVPLTDANLNSYLRFDDSAWNWGSVPIDQRGAFAFVLLPDALGAPNRVIALTYTPVPEPIWLLGAAFIGLAGFRIWRRSGSAVYSLAFSRRIAFKSMSAP
jgi:hypothetical protein